MNKEFKFLTEGLVILCFNSDIFNDVSLFLKNSEELSNIAFKCLLFVPSVFINKEIYKFMVVFILV